MNNFESIGAEYADEYAYIEDAWEHAISTDERVIAALHGITPDEREAFAADFGIGFAEPLHRGDLTDDERLTIALLREYRRAEHERTAPLTARQLAVLRWAGVSDHEAVNALLWTVARMIRRKAIARSGGSCAR